MIGLGVETSGKITPFFEEGTLLRKDIPDTGKGFILFEGGVVVKAIPCVALERPEDQLRKQLPVLLPDLADFP